MTERRKILLLGEFGVFTRRIARALSRDPGIECVIGVADARRRARFERETGGTVVAVPGDPHGVRRAVEGAFAVINARGPFAARNYTVAEQCAEAGVHYVDPADSTDYIGGLMRLARKAEKRGSLIVTAAAAAPTVTALLAEMLVPEFDRVQEIHACLAHGKSDCRDRATARAILNYVDVVARMKEKGRWREFKGWSRPRPVRFPAPVGRRRGYLCDMPDLDIFPRRYGAQTVTFRVALSSRASNVVLSLSRWLRRRGVVRGLPAPVTAALHAISVLPGFGDPRGGLGVELRGDRGGEPRTRSVFLLARDGNTPAIAAAPAIALVRKWVSRGVPASGVMPCVGLLDWADVRDAMRDHDIVLVRV